MTFPCVWQMASELDGWLSQAEGSFLYRAACAAALHGPIVEIGSWKGRSTTVLASAAREAGGGHVFAIDPFTGSEEHGRVWTFDAFRANLDRAGVSELVTPIVGYSHEVVDQVPNGIALLFIDGAHDYENAHRDFALYAPKVRAGGVIAFHDAGNRNWPGVRRVLRERVYGQLAGIGLADSIVYATNAPAGLADQMAAASVFTRIATRHALPALGRYVPLRGASRTMLRKAVYGLLRHPI